MKDPSKTCETCAYSGWVTTYADYRNQYSFFEKEVTRLYCIYPERLVKRVKPDRWCRKWKPYNAPTPKWNPKQGETK